MTIKELMELKGIAKIAKDLGEDLINGDEVVSLNYNAEEICICGAEDEDEELYVINSDGNVREATLKDVMEDATLHTYFYTGSPYKKDNLVVTDYSYGFDIAPTDEDVFNTAFSLDTVFDKLGIEMGDDLETPAGKLFEEWEDADDEDAKYEVLKKVAELPEIAAKINEVAV